MIVYIWVISAVAYLIALSNIVLLFSLKYKKMLDKETATVLVIKSVLWFSLATIGFGLAVTQ